MITKGVFSLEKSLESLDSPASLESRRILLCFPQSGGSLDSLNSLNSLENGLSEKTPFPKDPFFRTRPKHLKMCRTTQDVMFHAPTRLSKFTLPGAQHV